jgi:hypothetical protein
VIHRDGEAIAQLVPADVLLSGSTYQWDDKGASPAVQHSYTVRRIVAATGRSLAKSSNVTINPEGVWLVRDNGNSVVLDGDAIDQLITAERRLRYRPTNRQRAVDIVTQFEGISGPLELTVEDTDDQTFASAKQILDNIKRNPMEAVQLIFADVSKPVLVSNLTLLPDPDYRGDMNRHRVSFYVDQSATSTSGWPNGPRGAVAHRVRYRHEDPDVASPAAPRDACPRPRRRQPPTDVDQQDHRRPGRLRRDRERDPDARRELPRPREPARVRARRSVRRAAAPVASDPSPRLPLHPRAHRLGGVAGVHGSDHRLRPHRYGGVADLSRHGGAGVRCCVADDPLPQEVQDHYRDPEAPGRGRRRERQRPRPAAHVLQGPHDPPARLGVAPRAAHGPISRPLRVL